MDFLSLLNTIFAFIVVISIIVFIHEYGHYIVARWCKVRVEAFSIGFGPEIWGRNDKAGTRWKVCAVPLGGYVKMFGDVGAASTPDNDKLNQLSEAEQKVAFHCKSLPQKTAIVAAGPIANFILAIIVFTFFFSYYGKPYISSQISKVMENSAAAAAGLQAGDTIVSMDGKKIDRFEDIKRLLALHPNNEFNVAYLRDESILHTKVKPQLRETKDIFGNVSKVPILGIHSGIGETISYPVHSSFIMAFSETYAISKMTLIAVGQMLTGQRGVEELGGPIRIAQISGETAKQGLRSVLWLIAILTINLGLINLFPIPMLDGGHLLYYGIEALRGKPMAEKYQEYGFRFGLAIIVMLILFTTINDILRSFNLS